MAPFALPAALAPFLAATAEEGHDFVPHLAWVAPFVAMLLAIAVLPLAAPHWWHSNRNRFLVALGCGLPVFGLFALNGDWHTIGHTAHEYVSFLVLLAALYTASGGIVLRGDLKATPVVNTTFLLIGAVLASFMGTTGAAMLLIRPLIKTNSERRYNVHTVVFFIFAVCNVGGLLTPLGDPPLFLGYLRGVPFGWTFGLLPVWGFTVGAILAVYLVLDTVLYRCEDRSDLRADATQIEPLSFKGMGNFCFLGGIVAAVAFLTPGNVAKWLGTTETAPLPMFGRDLLLVLIATGAYLTTKPAYRKENEFTWEPILEVAALFFGIFLSMMAAIKLLRVHGSELGVDTPVEFFWVTGTLSAFLDNAPTYVVFFETASSLPARAVDTMVVSGGAIGIPLLTSISLGAVFMGAMSYIGNAPNFMVKAIAEQRKIKMPSFFGYLLYSMVFLLPIFFLVTQIFL
ncbi:MAG TPA: sodium:proton antiporter [Planctomycetota bacterium]